jgi:hypothetical protein
MFFSVKPVTLIKSSICPFHFSFSIHFIVFELARVDFFIDKLHGSPTLHLVSIPRPAVLLSICPLVITLPMDSVIKEVTVVDGTIWPLKDTTSIFFA